MKVSIFAVVACADELCNALALSFGELGYETEVHLDMNKPFEWGDINLMITGHHHVDVDAIPGYRILYQIEELRNRRDKDFYDKAHGFHLVLELYEENCNISKGTERVVHCPIGYSPAFENSGIRREQKELMDLCFFGSLTPRRKELLSEVDREFPNANKTFNENLWGDQRDYFIANSRINFYLKAHDRWSFTPLRFMLIQGKDRMYFSESSSEGLGPYVPEKHFIEFTDIREFGEKGAWWLERPEERKKFAMQVKQDLMENHGMTKYLKQALEGYLL